MQTLNVNNLLRVQLQASILPQEHLKQPCYVRTPKLFQFYRAEIVHVSTYNSHTYYTRLQIIPSGFVQKPGDGGEQER